MSLLLLQVAGGERQAVSCPSVRQRFVPARDQLPRDQANADDDCRNEEHQDHPGDADRCAHEMLLDPAADVEEGINRGRDDENPAEHNACESPPAQQHDCGESDDGPADVADNDFQRSSHGNRKTFMLGGEDLQGDVTEDVNPEQRDQRLGTSARGQPWRNIPARDRDEDKQAYQLRSCLCGYEVIHDCTLEASALCAVLSIRRRPKNMRPSRPSRSKKVWYSAATMWTAISVINTRDST